jgi:hypothetical protein
MNVRLGSYNVSLSLKKQWTWWWTRDGRCCWVEMGPVLVVVDPYAGS